MNIETKPRGNNMNKKTESTNTLVEAGKRSSVKAPACFTSNPVTNPPLELLLQKARDEEPARKGINTYEPVIRVLVKDKKFTAQQVRKWLSEHGAGNYGHATVATAITNFGKKWKAEAREAGAYVK